MSRADQSALANERMKALRRERAKGGLCVTCGHLAIVGKKKCAACRQRHQQYTQRWSAARTAEVRALRRKAKAQVSASVFLLLSRHPTEVLGKPIGVFSSPDAAVVYVTKRGVPDVELIEFSVDELLDESTP
jgi:hypothetical protein